MVRRIMTTYDDDRVKPHMTRYNLFKLILMIEVVADRRMKKKRRNDTGVAGRSGLRLTLTVNNMDYA